MILLKNAGRATIITPRHELLRQLGQIEDAGRECYNSHDKKTEDSAGRFIASLIKRGHESVLEHSSLTVKFDDVSRGFTHELVRHRHCAFSQQSTRYVRIDDARIVVHHDVDEDIITPTIMNQLQLYKNAIDFGGHKPEDARQYLPIGIVSPIVCTANFREWRHILRLRTAKPTHWEIRFVMRQLLQISQQLIPVVFDDINIEDNNNGNIYPSLLTAKTIRRERERRGLSQASLAAKVGVSKSAINHWEKKRRKPSEYNREGIALVFEECPVLEGE